jgi:hypothetical protein
MLFWIGRHPGRSPTTRLPTREVLALKTALEHPLQIVA